MITLIVISIILFAYSIFATYVLIKKHNDVHNLRDWIYFYSEKTLLIQQMMTDRRRHITTNRQTRLTTTWRKREEENLPRSNILQ